VLSELPPPAEEREMSLNERARRAWVLYTSDPRIERGQKSYLAAVGFLFAALAVLVAIEGDWWGVCECAS